MTTNNHNSASLVAAVLRRAAERVVTRAKKGVVIVGDRKGLEYALKQTRESDRMTALRHRIDEEIRRRRVA